MDRRRARIDLGRETTIPGHDHSTVLVDLRDDATVAGAQARVVTRGCDQLDSRPNRHAGADPCCEKSCPLRVHTRGIGFDGLGLYPPQPGDGRRGHRIGEVAWGRRIAPNSTA